MNRSLTYSILALVFCTRLAADPADNLEDSSVNYDDFRLLHPAEQIETAWQLYYSSLVPPATWDNIAVKQRDIKIASDYVKIINERTTETETIRAIVFERLNRLDTINNLGAEPRGCCSHKVLDSGLIPS